MTPSSTLDLLKRYESRNVTFMEEDRSWPIVWERARGVHVWDEKGTRYLDLTGAFGVAAAGHANPHVVKAGQKQMARLLHAMGDVHPHALKAQLARELSRITFERWNAGDAKTIFGNSGFEAVEAALKTAMLATNKPRLLAFEGSYHGLGYGALNVTHREHFKNPFRRQLAQFAGFTSFPQFSASPAKFEQDTREILGANEIGAVLVEPIQARGGINVPPAWFLPLLRSLCDEHNCLLVLDEVYTGFGRTGEWFACDHAKIVPDVICLGKALTGGFPLSACVGRAELMDRAWPSSTGEAIHTSTFLGHPVGCAMALAQIKELESANLPARSAQTGEHLLANLQALSLRGEKIALKARGQGLLAGLEFKDLQGHPSTKVCLDLIKKLLHAGFLFLPEGEHSNVLAFTPPLTITIRQLDSALRALHRHLEEYL
jgi:4-aminobutyrate aminotransferase-like enzyme